jgi:hypothetical protein
MVDVRIVTGRKEPVGEIINRWNLIVEPKQNRLTPPEKK